MNRPSVVGGVMLLALAATPTVAQVQWAQFRGANAGGVGDNPALPETWSETENVVWTIDVPGLAWSSPVVWDDHIFITSAISAGDKPDPIPGLYDPGDHNGSRRSTQHHRWVVYDIDFDTGAIRWARELHSAAPTMARHIKNSFASETPVTDGRRVYVYFGTAGVVGALNMSGETVWLTELGAYETTGGFGSAASPTLHGDRLYVVNDNVRQSFMVALDKHTGEEIWRVERQERGQNWATPFVWENEVRTEIVTAGPEFEILHKNPLNEMTLATQAIVRGSLILRTQSKLYRIAEGGHP